MSNPSEKLLPEKIYHLYNHGNARDNIFCSDENFNFFLKRYVHYIYPVAHTIAYCLMPNHFHFAIKIKSEKELTEYITSQSSSQTSRVFETCEVLNNEIYSKYISNCLSNFFNSYAKSFNKVFERKGSLFLENVKKKPVDNADYLINLIRYIHQNPVDHGFTKYPDEWKFSSYNAYVSEKKTLLDKVKY